MIILSHDQIIATLLRAYCSKPYVIAIQYLPDFYTDLADYVDHEHLESLEDGHYLFREFATKEAAIGFAGMIYDAGPYLTLWQRVSDAECGYSFVRSFAR